MPVLGYPVIGDKSTNNTWNSYNYIWIEIKIQ